nr:hypothetical protein [Mycobacterium mantenii]
MTNAAVDRAASFMVSGPSGLSVVCSRYGVTDEANTTLRTRSAP